jgi:hypothetical protein
MKDGECDRQAYGQIYAGYSGTCGHLITKEVGPPFPREYLYSEGMIPNERTRKRTT